MKLWCSALSTAPAGCMEATAAVRVAKEAGGRVHSMAGGSARSAAWVGGATGVAAEAEATAVVVAAEMRLPSLPGRRRPTQRTARAQRGSMSITGERMLECLASWPVCCMARAQHLFRPSGKQRENVGHLSLRRGGHEGSVPRGVCYPPPRSNSTGLLLLLLLLPAAACCCLLL